MGFIKTLIWIQLKPRIRNFWVFIYKAYFVSLVLCTFIYFKGMRLWAKGKIEVGYEQGNFICLRHFYMGLQIEKKIHIIFFNARATFSGLPLNIRTMVNSDKYSRGRKSQIILIYIGCNKNGFCSGLIHNNPGVAPSN